MSEFYSWDKFVGQTNEHSNTTKHKSSDNDVIHDLICQLSPDASDHVQNIVALYIHQELGDAGATMYDDWRKNSSDYPGHNQTKEEYISYTETNQTVDLALLQKLISESNSDTNPLASAQNDNAAESGKSLTNVPPETTRKPTIFDKHSLTGKSHILEEQQLDKVYVLDKLALAGQSTIFFAPPNTGKTLLILRLLFDSIQDGRINAADTYYIDHDDSHNSLLEKLHLFEELSSHILADGYENLKANDFIKQVDEICKHDQARGKVFVLDTLKKFVDPMNKRQCTEWGRSMRRLTAKGASIISLAHTNKKFDSDGWPIHAGVNDLVDDADAAFLMRIANKDEAALVATVELKNIKRRGDVVDNIAFRFSYDPKISYPERLASVEHVDDVRLEALKLADSIKADDELISIASKCIEEGFSTKMILRDEISKHAGISKRKAVQLIEKYEGTDPDKHRWNHTVHEHNKHVYQILNGGSEDE